MRDTRAPPFFCSQESLAELALTNLPEHHEAAEDSIIVSRPPACHASIAMTGGHNMAVDLGAS